MYQTEWLADKLALLITLPEDATWLGLKEAMLNAFHLIEQEEHSVALFMDFGPPDVPPRENFIPEAVEVLNTKPENLVLMTIVGATRQYTALLVEMIDRELPMPIMMENTLEEALASARKRLQ